jgi:hypothetical protein
MRKNEFTKDPDALLDYAVDWTDWLQTDAFTDYIILSVWIVPSGITKFSDSNTSTISTIWLMDGTNDKTYEVVNRIDTSLGRINDQTIIVHVIDK